MWQTDWQTPRHSICRVVHCVARQKQHPVVQHMLLIFTALPPMTTDFSLDVVSISVYIFMRFPVNFLPLPCVRLSWLLRISFRGWIVVFSAERMILTLFCTNLSVFVLVLMLQNGQWLWPVLSPLQSSSLPSYLFAGACYVITVTSLLLTCKYVHRTASSKLRKRLTSFIFIISFFLFFGFTDVAENAVAENEGVGNRWTLK